jgi:hypothetical protein
MASTEQAPLAPKPQQGSAPCAPGGCADLGLGHVVGFTQKLWKDVSHTPFLGCGCGPAAPVGQKALGSYSVG